MQNDTERLRTLFLPELGAKLKNLTGYTTYLISVAAFNAAGDSPRSPATRGRTQQAGGCGWVGGRRTLCSTVGLSARAGLSH